MRRWAWAEDERAISARSARQGEALDTAGKGAPGLLFPKAETGYSHAMEEMLPCPRQKIPPCPKK
ncbi:hypothetical protein TRIP_E160017 [uncultured Spirochaetota bacterium]|nr:hypothetical protein TRIP_E160017 [uncultured Spirochaetota bacterium]